MGKWVWAPQPKKRSKVVKERKPRVQTIVRFQLPALPEVGERVDNRLVNIAGPSGREFVEEMHRMHVGMSGLPTFFPDLHNAKDETCGQPANNDAISP